MPGRALSLARISCWALTLGLLAGVGLPAGALAAEPVAVRAEGVWPLAEGESELTRERAFEAAVLEAVVHVARMQLGRDLGPEELEALRTALAPRAADALVTYRIEPGAGPRPVAGDPGRSEYAVTVLATLDEGQVRKLLTRAGWLSLPPDQTSVVVVAHAAPGESELAPSLLRQLTEALEQRLDEAGYVVIPSMPGADAGGAPRNALTIAQALGSDVVLDAQLRWVPRAIGQNLAGGSLQVSIRAQRTRDGSLLASSRFDAPAYHKRLPEAQRRALAALQSQVADNALQQLRDNWTILAGRAPPVDLRLADVTGLSQVEDIRRALLTSLGAKRASLERLAPRLAVLQVESTLSPGALAERLGASQFSGFRLEQRAVRATTVELRLVPVASETPPGGASPGVPRLGVGAQSRGGSGR